MNTQDFLNKEELSQILGGANSENILSENEEQDILLKPSCTGPSCSNSCTPGCSAGCSGGCIQSSGANGFIRPES